MREWDWDAAPKSESLSCWFGSRRGDRESLKEREGVIGDKSRDKQSTVVGEQKNSRAKLGAAHKSPEQGGDDEREE